MSNENPASSRHKMRIYTERDITERFFPRRVKINKHGKKVYDNRSSLKAFAEGRIDGTPTSFRTCQKTGKEFVKTFTITPKEWKRLCAYGLRRPSETGVAV